MKLKVKLNSFIIFLILLTYLKPFNVSLIPRLNSIYTIVKLLATLILAIYIMRRKISLTRASIWCIGFLTWWTFSMVLNNNLKNNIQILLSIFGILFFLNIMRTKKDGIKVILKLLSCISKIYILLHFYTILFEHPIFAKSIVSFDKYFLGSDNYSAFILIPLSGFIVCESLMNKKTITIESYIFVAIAFLCLLIPKSWSGIFSYTVFVLLCIFRKSKHLKNIVNIRNILIVMIIFLISIIVFNVQIYLTDILKLFGKVGLSSREIIWPKSIFALMKRPFQGYGLLTNEQISSYILYGTTHTHNIILEFMFDSGLVGTFFAFMWFKTAVTINKKVLHNEAILVINYCIVAYLICSTLDFYITLIYFWLLIIFYDCIKKSICERDEKVEYE